MQPDSYYFEIVLVLTYTPLLICNVLVGSRGGVQASFKCHLHLIFFVVVGVLHKPWIRGTVLGVNCVLVWFSDLNTTCVRSVYMLYKCIFFLLKEKVNLTKHFFITKFE